MEIDKTIPITRKWLEEAYKIAKGDREIKPKKEHVTAAIDCLEQLRKQSETLRGLMLRAYQESCKRRAAAGEPMPPPPPILANELAGR